MRHASSPRRMKAEIRRTLRRRPGGPLPYKVNTRKAVRARDARAAEWPDFEDRRAEATLRRQEVIDRLDELHRMLRDKWRHSGIVVHEARDVEAARQAVLQIVRNAGADRLMKSKTMLSEEIELNGFLAEHGIAAVETDLGEYIVQLRGETPSHITMPAMHLDRRDIGRLFAEKLGTEYTEEPPALTRIARSVLRRQFLEAEVGLIGVNFAVAETGHIATVTNEGNGRMMGTLPRVVIALMGRERVTRSLADLGLLWQLLARSATGQRATVYLNLLGGPSPGGSRPDEVHVIVVDNGRKQLEDDAELREVLRCIRCGACLNACPVYQQVGGHPYGGTYPGPLGAVLTPALRGIREAPDHPFASSLCGSCEEICPMSIPLPKMLLALRQRSVQQRGMDPERTAWRLFRDVMSDEKRYERAAALARTVQHVLPERLFVIPGWTNHRDAPKLAPRPFRDLIDDSSSEGGVK